jgi:IS30 family transposase
MLKKHKHLTQEERWHIYMLKGSGNSVRNIAKSLNRDPSVISREIKRNSINQSYRPAKAHKQYIQRRVNASSRSRVMTSELQIIIESKLRLLWSPEQISGRLKADGVAYVSYETIYKMIWKDKQNGGDLYRCLRHGGKKYNKRSGKNSGRGLIPNRVDIELRDQIVEEKSRIGDLEADTVIGANHKGAIVTLVDRMSKFSLFTLVPNKTKESVTKAIENSLRAFKKTILTITFDNGKEFAGHQDIASTLEVKCFFARPYHSWERGLNEHTNGLLRQYIPKKSDFEQLTQTDIDIVQNALNNRPRKVLNYRTPAEVFFEHTSVAFTA